ncbi:DUF1772 domain-containing protein [Marinomonas gallaica]|nr:DUF1772 domain-containing protein [Marinomonas gallaica]
MMTKFLLNQSKFISILMFGMMAGFFATYSFNVNYAMLQVDGATYATVQSLFNINVRHLGFFLCFFGAAVAPLITSLLLFINAERRKALIWAVLSLLYILGIIVFTKFINLPLNYYTESWDPKHLPNDWQEIRDNWNQANLYRTWVCIGLFSIALSLSIQRT